MVNNKGGSKKQYKKKQKDLTRKKSQEKFRKIWSKIVQSWRRMWRMGNYQKKSLHKIQPHFQQITMEILTNQLIYQWQTI